MKVLEVGFVCYEINVDGLVNYSVFNLGDGSGGIIWIGNVLVVVNDMDVVNYV